MILGDSLLYKGVCFSDMIGLSEDEKKDDYIVKNLFKRNIRTADLMPKIFGENFEKEYNPAALNRRELEWSLRFINHKVDWIEFYRYSMNKKFRYEGMTLLEIFDTTLEFMDYLIKYHFSKDTNYSEIINLLPSIFGTQLQNRGNFAVCNVVQKALFVKLRFAYKHLVDESKREDNYKTIYEYLDCTIDEFKDFKNSNFIDSKTSDMLSKEFGVTFLKKANINLLNSFERVLWDTFAQTAVKKLNKIRKEYQKEEEKKQKKLAKKSQLTKTITLQMFLNCSDDDIAYLRTIKYRKNDTHKLIVKLFGEDFSKKVDFSSLTHREKTLIASFKHDSLERLEIYHQNIELVKSYNGRKLQDILNCSDRYLDKVRSRLKNSSQKRLIEKAFGVSLNVTFHFFRFTNIEKNEIAKFIDSCIKQKTKDDDIEYFSADYVIKRFPNLFNLPTDELEFVYFKIIPLKNRNGYRLLYKIRQGEGISGIEFQKLKIFINSIIKRLPLYEEEFLARKNENQAYKIKLCRDLNCSLDYFNKLLLNIVFDSPDFELIRNYGNGKELSQEDLNRMWHVIKIAKGHLLCDDIPFTGRTLREILNCKSEELAYLLENTHCNYNTERYVVLVKLFGPSLSDKCDYSKLTKREKGIFSMLYREWLNKIEERRVSQNSILTSRNRVPEILLPSDTITIESPFNNPEFIKLMDYMPEEYRYFTILRLGLYDGQIYSISTIASLYNVSEELVTYLTTAGFNHFKIILDSYLDKYESMREVSEIKRVLQLLDSKNS